MNSVNLNLSTVEVKAQTRALRASWTYEIADDFEKFQYYANFYQYKIENQNEIDIIKEHFNVENIFGEQVYYNLNKRDLRKIKLLILRNDKLSEVIKKIINNSREADSQEYMESLLSNELLNNIDKKILKDIMNLK